VGIMIYKSRRSRSRKMSGWWSFSDQGILEKKGNSVSISRIE